jgi:hypothetical protein
MVFTTLLGEEIGLGLDVIMQLSRFMRAFYPRGNHEEITVDPCPFHYVIKQYLGLFANRAFRSGAGL